jgi:uncharacterized protein (TIRG00374 family)
VSHKQNLHLIVGLLLAAVLLAVVLRGVDWPLLLEAFRRAEPLPLVGLLCMTVVMFVIRSWRWGYLLRPLAPVPFLPLFSATWVGFLSGLVVPRAGEVLRPYLVSRRHDVSTSAGFATIILERLIDLITVLFLFGAYLYVLPTPAEQTRGGLLDVLEVTGAFAGLGALVVLAILFAFHANAERALSVAERLLSRLPAKIAGPLLNLIKSFSSGLAVLKAPIGLLAVIAGQSLLLWLVIAASFYLNNLAFGIRLPFHATFLLLAFLTVGVAIPTPGSVGGFHAFYLACLTQAFGVTKEAAVAAGIAGHAISNIPVLGFGLYFLWREGLSFSKVAELADSEKDGNDSEAGK